MIRAVDECGKHAHATRRKAQLHRRQLRDYTLTIYPCPHGAGFHVGHRGRKQGLPMARRTGWRAMLSEDVA